MPLYVTLHYLVSIIKVLFLVCYSLGRCSGMLLSYLYLANLPLRYEDRAG